jgi:endonuclease YncB( thermonuclease family)
VDLKRSLIVRLIDFDAPETFRPKSEAEKAHGLEATQFLKDLLEGENVVLFVPAGEDGKISDIYSIGGRIEGHLFVNGRNVADILRENGYEKKLTYESY